jgi:hypothetical protein
MGNRDKSDALMILHIICKVFFKANYLKVCPYLMKIEALDPWIQFFKTILDMPTPSEL